MRSRRRCQQRQRLPRLDPQPSIAELGRGAESEESAEGESGDLLRRMKAVIKVLRLHVSHGWLAAVQDAAAGWR